MVEEKRTEGLITRYFKRWQRERQLTPQQRVELKKLEADTYFEEMKKKAKERGKEAANAE